MSWDILSRCIECGLTEIEHSRAWNFGETNPMACDKFKELTFPYLVEQELIAARAKFPEPESLPPGWTRHQLMHYWLGVIWEEFIELRDDVFEQHLSINVTKELAQIAAMCQRAAESCGFTRSVNNE